MGKIGRVLRRHPFLIVAALSWLALYIPSLLPESAGAAAMPLLRVAVMPIWGAMTFAMVLTAPLRQLAPYGWLSGVTALVTIAAAITPFILADAAVRRWRNQTVSPTPA